MAKREANNEVVRFKAENSGLTGLIAAQAITLAGWQKANAPGGWIDELRQQEVRYERDIDAAFRWALEWASDHENDGGFNPDVAWEEYRARRKGGSE